MSCNYEPYVLPTIDFVGGETQNLAFHIYFCRDDKPYGLSGCNCNFSIINHVNKNGVPVISKQMTITTDDLGIDNVLEVKIDPKDTVDLYGKYVYQISIMDEYDNTEVRQGVLYIANNINKGFIQ